jgi:hypothetical protein
MFPTAIEIVFVAKFFSFSEAKKRGGFKKGEVVCLVIPEGIISRLQSN